MTPLDHKRTTSSLTPPIFYVVKKSAIKRWKAPHWMTHKGLNVFLYIDIEKLLAQLNFSGPEFLFAKFREVLKKHLAANLI